MGCNNLVPVRRGRDTQPGGGERTRDDLSGGSGQEPVSSPVAGTDAVGWGL